MSNTHTCRTVVTTDNPALTQRARTSAEKYGLLYVDADDPIIKSGWDYLLVYRENEVALTAADQQHGPVTINYTTGRTAHRRRYGGGRNQPLARAIGLQKKHINSVMDATAGFGADAFVIAALGCNVTLIERSPVLAMMLEHALSVARQDTDVATIANRMHLVHADASDYLASASTIDTVYLDPMYPLSRNTARVKKAMQALHNLVGPDQNNDDLLDCARAVASQRVVVKRPRLTPPLQDTTPDTCIRSPNTRYDVYLTLNRK